MHGQKTLPPLHRDKPRLRKNRIRKKRKNPLPFLLPAGIHAAGVAPIAGRITLSRQTPSGHLSSPVFHSLQTVSENHPAAKTVHRSFSGISLRDKAPESLSRERPAHPAGTPSWRTAGPAACRGAALPATKNRQSHRAARQPEKPAHHLRKFPRPRHFSRPGLSFSR